MVPAKYKFAHYITFRFQPLDQFLKQMSRWYGIYDEADIIELEKYFFRKCEKDILSVAQLFEEGPDREEKILNTVAIYHELHKSLQAYYKSQLEKQFIL